MRLKTVLKDALRRQGFELRRRRDDFHYAPDYYGRSFGLRTDIRKLPVFSEHAARTIAEGRSCLYYDRLYILYDALVSLARYAGDSPRIIEVGVYKGGTSAYLADLAKAVGMPNAQVHSFDTFEGHAAIDVNREVDPVHRAGDFHNTSFEAVSAYLASHANVTVYKGRFEDRCRELGDAPIAMIHLDVDLYGPTLHALRFVDERIIAGGVCIVDDYEVTQCPGVKTAVGEFLHDHPGYFSMHPHTEQCVLVKRGGR